MWQKHGLSSTAMNYEDYALIVDYTEISALISYALMFLFYVCKATNDFKNTYPCALYYYKIPNIKVLIHVVQC
jgi:hypothetical protein